ncbi:MAG TPA: hypothetical protein VK574_02210 [Terracidiphilus sp.]|nr:hypothetical protein [Terracidiphilus sp.]
MMMEPAKRANLDRIMAAEEELAPSSGFVSAVMERVREEAAAPEPIPFPWKRALPGAVVAVGGLAWLGVEVARQGLNGLPNLGSPVALWAHMPQQMVATLESAGWLAAALGASLLSWLLARRMVGRGGLI